MPKWKVSTLKNEQSAYGAGLFERERHQQIRPINAHIPAIFVTMAKAADAAIEAMRQGAYDYPRRS